MAQSDLRPKLFRELCIAESGDTSLVHLTNRSPAECNRKKYCAHPAGCRGAERTKLVSTYHGALCHLRATPEPNGLGCSSHSHAEARLSFGRDGCEWRSKDTGRGHHFISYSASHTYHQRQWQWQMVQKYAHHWAKDVQHVNPADTCDQIRSTLY